MLLHHAQTKIKQPLCVCTRELSDGWARVDVASRAVFALSSATAPMLFESARIREFHAHTKTKTSAYFHTLRFFGGRGWIARAALLKTAHRAVFAPSSATSPQLFESARVREFHAQSKQKPQRTFIR